MVEDKLLIWKCKRGSRAAFRRIYEKYESDLRTLAANLLNDKAAAEDVVHDVFVSLLQVVDKFELRSSLAGYLKTCVANRSRDYMRRRQRQTAAINDEEQVLPSNDGPIHLVIKSEELQKLGSAMNQIPYEQREAIVLRLHGQMKFRTIAELQNVTIKTAHSRYRAGIEGLKLILNSEV
ncbi:MAG: RNA polymerase sigma factor [Planctomycetes bacterium]|nr:RNA polymerase sigma factor [Planctomycetota bacterium]MBL7145053.1 RNA polymerase sigma factor [Phycisphaerae bacterium]